MERTAIRDLLVPGVVGAAASLGMANCFDVAWENDVLRLKLTWEGREKSYPLVSDIEARTGSYKEHVAQRIRAAFDDFLRGANVTGAGKFLERFGPRDEPAEEEVLT